MQPQISVIPGPHPGSKDRIEPWDAFWGQRYAVLHDPDGNAIDLVAALPTPE